MESDPQKKASFSLAGHTLKSELRPLKRETSFATEPLLVLERTNLELETHIPRRENFLSFVGGRKEVAERRGGQRRTGRRTALLPASFPL